MSKRLSLNSNSVSTTSILSLSLSSYITILCWYTANDSILTVVSYLFRRGEESGVHIQHKMAFELTYVLFYLLCIKWD